VLPSPHGSSPGPAAPAAPAEATPAAHRGPLLGLAHNAANPAAYFHLPVERTVVMGSRIEL
jgi:hypothetical protein